MAFDPAKAQRMNQLAQQYPRAPIGTLATLANIPASEIGNYTQDDISTPGRNANFGRIVQTQATEVNNANSSVNNTSAPGSGTAFQGGGTNVASAFDNRVDETAAFEQEFDGAGQTQALPTPRPVVPQGDVDFPDAYGESYREPTPIPTDTRFPTSRTSELTQNTVDPGLANAVRAREQAAIEASNAFTESPAPDPYPAPPPARPVESFDTPVDNFQEYQPPVTQVDDFADFQSPAQVDDFSEYQAPAQVDDFAEFSAPPQVDDFSAYSNNNFGTEDPGLDAFGPGPTPPAPAITQEYDNTQFDPFGDVVQETAPAQVDDFSAYSNNNFGAQVDDFAEINTPVQVDDFSGYSNNDFGAQVDDFSDYQSPNDVNQFGVDDFGDNNPLGQVDDFGEYSSPAEVNPFGVDDFGDAEVAQFDEFGDPILAPERVENDGESLVGDDPVADIGDGAEGAGIDGVEQAAISAEQQAALDANAMKVKAQQQQTISEMREASGVKNADGDWRVKLRLAPQATYLYKAPEPGILAPLAITDGIIFPYTPTIDVQYRAEYQNYSPTHSNYQHYFYKNSSVQTVQLQADFTAQDTIEAEYLLACIHFLKSASKMFYGQDAERGSPPPLLYLTGLGEYQFNESPCVVTEFNYNLPSDVNYIRARSRHINRDDRLQFSKPLATSTTNGNFSALNRLKTAVTNAFSGGPGPSLAPGAKPTALAPSNLGTKGATYVPTKMSMTINMLPIVSRQQASQQFSLREYANGNLIKKGMW